MISHYSLPVYSGETEADDSRLIGVLLKVNRATAVSIFIDAASMVSSLRPFFHFSKIITKRWTYTLKINPVFE